MSVHVLVKTVTFSTDKSLLERCLSTSKTEG